MPRSLLTLASRQEGLLSAAQCDDAGVSTTRRGRLVANGEWARVTRGVFDVDPRRDRRGDPDHRRRRQAWTGLLAYGPDAIAVGACALALHGVMGLPLDVSPEVALPGGRSLRSRDGVRVRQYGSSATMRFGSRAVVALVPALAQALPELARENAVAILDDVLHRGLVAPRGFDEVRDLVRRRRGGRRVARWCELVDGRSESPLESVARLRCLDGGVPPDQLQVEIRDGSNRLVGRGDLGWRLRGGRWLIAEIDGREFHESPNAVFHDRTRQNALVNTGRVDLLRFTSRDVASPSTIPTAVRAVLARDER